MINDNELVELINRQIELIEYPEVGSGLFRPIAYTLEGGGKRLRPLLALMTCQAFCGDATRALHQAIGLEMFHNFTLIHDDVMDRSPRRHNRQTVYRRWGDVQAILSGDALLTMSMMEVLKGAGSHAGTLMDLFNKTAMEVYEGQQLDMDFEDCKKVTMKRYMTMIRLKTSVLLAASCAMGAIMGGASEAEIEAMYVYGEKLGLAFQLRDDWLDVFGDPRVFGKSIGNDIVTRKKTWLFIRTEEIAGREALDAIYEKDVCNNRLVAYMTALYNDYKIGEKCNAEIWRYVSAAIAALPESIDAESREWFTALAMRLADRKK